MAVIALTGTQIATDAPPFDSGAVAGDFVYVAENATLIASTGNGGLVANAFSPCVDLTYLINGEVFGGWDSYTEEVTIQIGSTGMCTVAYFFQLNQAHVINAGTMASTTNMVISKYDDPSGSTLNDLILTNTGSIVAGLNDQYPSRSAIDSGAALTQIFNSGEILASTSGAITVSWGVAEISNSGLIRGDISLSATNDTVTNSGTIDGDVNLSAGSIWAQAMTATGRRQRAGPSARSMAGLAMTGSRAAARTTRCKAAARMT